MSNVFCQLGLAREKNNYAYNWNVTNTWNAAASNYAYFKKSSLSSWTMSIKVSLYSLSTIYKKIRDRGTAVGDLIYFADNGSFTPNHAGIVTSLYPVCFAAHTDDYMYRNISYFVRNHPNGRIFIVHMR